MLILQYKHIKLKITFNYGAISSLFAPNIAIHDKYNFDEKVLDISYTFILTIWA